MKDTKSMFRKIKAIHFVGIGGSGMSGIAEVLLSFGYQVSGSDLNYSPTIAHLEEIGARVNINHDPQNIEGSEVVVVSSAVKSDNPELIAARYRNIPIIPRAEMLAEIMRLKYGIAVAGAHGKTTTTSMLAHILEDSGMDPTVVIGGRLDKYNANAKAGMGDLMVAEADESDGSFMRLSPTIAIVTNLDEEHLDHYKGGLQEIQDTFLAFMNKVPFYGLVVACKDDPYLEMLLPKVTRKLITFGLHSGADLSAANIKPDGFGMNFELMVRGAKYGDISLSVPGNHNVANALAAIAVGLEFDVPMDIIRSSLKKFTGADRRFHIIGEYQERTFIDDYAHHPTEILATLKAAKSAWSGRVVGIFQPHRYTRLRDNWDKFLDSFGQADHLVVCPVFAAGESPINNVDSETFVEELKKKHASVSFLDSLEGLAGYMRNNSKEGDLLIGLGAGSISKQMRVAFKDLSENE